MHAYHPSTQNCMWILAYSIDCSMAKNNTGNYWDLIQPLANHAEKRAGHRINLQDASNNDALWGEGADRGDAFLGRG
jgi:hypothetical protein